MNIKNRIKNLEVKTGIEKEFCSCFQQYFEAQTRQVYGNEPFDESKFTLPETGYCPKCRRQVSKVDLDVVQNINEIYGGMEI